MDIFSFQRQILRLRINSIFLKMILVLIYNSEEQLINNLNSYVRLHVYLSTLPQVGQYVRRILSKWNYKLNFTSHTMRFHNRHHISLCAGTTAASKEPLFVLIFSICTLYLDSALKEKSKEWFLNFKFFGMIHKPN